VSGVPLYDARHQIFGRLHLEHILLSPTSAIWFSHSLACAEIWDSLRAVLLAHSESVQDIMCSFPPSWVHTTPLSSTSSSMECARHPLHVCPSPSIWWEEDIDKERCKLKVAHQHVGHTLRLTAREWTLELLQVPSLVLVNKEWTQPILDEWCSNPLILQDPMCPRSSCRCHRGHSKFCSWRCSRPTSGYQGCIKRNHPRFHDHFKFYMVNSATELLPKYCTGISVVSSPKFKGVPPYTLMEFRPHIGFVVAPTPSLSSAAPEPSPPPSIDISGSDKSSTEAFCGASLSRLEMWSINALLLLDAKMEKSGRTRRALHVALARFQSFVRQHSGRLNLPYHHRLSALFRHVYTELLQVTNELVRDGVLEWAELSLEESHLVRDFHRLYIRLRPGLHQPTSSDEASLASDHVIEVDAIDCDAQDLFTHPSEIDRSTSPPPSTMRSITPDIETSTATKSPLGSHHVLPLETSPSGVTFPARFNLDLDAWPTPRAFETRPYKDLAHEDHFMDDLPTLGWDCGGINTVTAAPVAGLPFISTHAPFRPTPSPVTRAFMEQYSQVGEHWIRYDHTIGALVVRLEVGGIMVNAAIDLAAKYSLMSREYYATMQLDLETHEHSPFFGVGPYGAPRIWTQKIRRTAASIGDISTDFEAYLSNEGESVNFTFILGRDWADRHGAIVGSMHAPFQLLLHPPAMEPIDSFEAPLVWNARPTTHAETMELRTEALDDALISSSLMLQAVAAHRPATLEPPLLVGERYVSSDSDSDSDSDYALEIDDEGDELDYSSEDDATPMLGPA
jgi:hypothetical protein